MALDWNSALPYLSPRILQRSEVTLLAAMYFPWPEIERAVAVAELESDFNTSAWDQSGEDSRGLWQINVKAWPQWANWNLFDPTVNAYCAYQVFTKQGWAAWLNSARKLHIGGY